MKTYSLKKHHKPNHFEGYYIRILSDDKMFNYAFIMAVSTHEDDPHAFLQIFDGQKGENTYIRYSVDDFYLNNGIVFLGENRLSQSKLVIQSETFEGEFVFKHHQSLKKSAMGFLRFFPLECFQEVLSMHSTIEGKITVNGTKKLFKGTSYQEKTYGKNFPTKWFWIQANDFSDASVSLSSAGGDVPLFKKRIFGFFAILKTAKKTWVFSSYKLSKFSYKDHQNTIVLIFKSWRYTLELSTKILTPTCLKGPSKYGKMDLDVFESLSNEVSLTLKKGNQVIFQDTSQHAGLEWMLKNHKE